MNPLTDDRLTSRTLIVTGALVSGAVALARGQATASDAASVIAALRNLSLALGAIRASTTDSTVVSALTTMIDIIDGLTTGQPVALTHKE